MSDAKPSVMGASMLGPRPAAQADTLDDAQRLELATFVVSTSEAVEWRPAVLESAIALIESAVMGSGDA